MEKIKPSDSKQKKDFATEGKDPVAETIKLVTDNSIIDSLSQYYHRGYETFLKQQKVSMGGHNKVVIS